MKRKTIAIAITAGVLALGMTACGEQQEIKNPDISPIQSTENTASAENIQSSEDKQQKEENKANQEKSSSESKGNTGESSNILFEHVEGDSTTWHIERYKTVLDTHYQAISEKWDMGRLMEEGLSPLLTYCYEGNALDNIAFSFADINADGKYELFIQPVSGDEFVDGMIFEMYTLKDNEPEQVLCGEERNRYYLSDTEEGVYFICQYSSSGALQSMWNYFVLEGDSLSLMQGILYDAEENPDQPWSFAFSEDEDSDKEAIEKLANDIIESYDKNRMQPEPFSFSLYK